MTLNGNPNLRRVVKGSENGKYTAEDSAIVSMKEWRGSRSFYAR